MARSAVNECGRQMGGRAWSGRLLLAHLLILLASCATPPSGDSPTPWEEIEDGPPLTSVDLSSVREPVPKQEPRSRSGNPDSYSELGGYYEVMESEVGYRERGVASWYGRKFHGRRTSSGEPYDMLKMTAAHRTLPLPSYVRVTHLENGREVVVKVNDRGPFHDERIIDLSYAAASRIGIVESGTGPVEVVALTPWLDPPQPAPAANVVREEALPASRNQAASSVIASTTPDARPASPPYYLQAGRYQTRAEAMVAGKRLEQLAIAPSVELVESQPFALRLGPFQQLEQAQRVHRHLVAQQFAGVEIISR